MNTPRLDHAVSAKLPMVGLSQLLQRLPGARVVGALPEQMMRVHTDTRHLKEGE